MPEIPTLIRLPSVWPKLNKQERIGSYLEQVHARDFDHCIAEIEETVCLTCDEWDDFRQHLLTPRTWLAGKGGCPERGVRSVILVVRPGETAADSLGIFVDPQGYEYARYIGFYCGPLEKKGAHFVTNPPNLPTLAEAMTATLDGISYKDRVLHETQAVSAAWLETRQPQDD